MVSKLLRHVSSRGEGQIVKIAQRLHCSAHVYSYFSLCFRGACSDIQRR